ncbi:MAG: VIT1/CCC1 transporter family protein [Actinomycetaceae bacterium]|nr:VIT1/CCC1 transporter family protein [Actinomycetaceae bacterium]
MAESSPTPEQIKRWRRYLAEERMEQKTYRDLADRRSGEEADILRQLADAEQRHEQYWLGLLGEHANPAPKPALNSRILAGLARMFGSIFVLALAQRGEQRETYDVDSDATEEMAADEHIHGEVVRGLAARSRARMAGTFRAAVFGANDGLVSNLALILGIAATGTSNAMVIATGIAGLLAGALSMAAGEYISVTSQRELLEASDPSPDAHRQVGKLNVKSNELELVFRARGDSPEESKKHARLLLEVINRPESELTTGSIVTSRSLLGSKERSERSNSDSHEEIGHAWAAGASSFMFFAVGALIPLLPFLFGLSGVTGVIVSAVIVGMALLFTGGIVGVLSGKPPTPRALRQLAIGYGAAAVTYTLGLVFGSSAI